MDPLRYQSCQADAETPTDMVPKADLKVLKQRLREKETMRNEYGKLTGKSRGREKANRCLDVMLYTLLGQELSSPRAQQLLAAQHGPFLCLNQK